MRTSKILSLSLPPTLLREAERVAKKEGRTKSELFREALRRYLQERRWAALRRYGVQRVTRLGLKETDVERVDSEWIAASQGRQVDSSGKSKKGLRKPRSANP